MKFFSFIEMITGSEFILHFLKSKNVDQLFGYSGGANLHLLNEINKQNIPFLANRHEQMTGHSAQGYAKISDQPGCIITTSGPGVTNMITPLYDAYLDSTPLFLITGNVASKNLGTQAFQEVNATSLTKSCTKWNYCVTNVLELPFVLDYAYNKAVEGKKGPVHIDICSDIFSKTIDSVFLPNHIPIIKEENLFEKKKELSRIESKIQNSKKPVFIIGKGSFSAIKWIRKFSREYNIPIATTLHGVGIINEREPLSLGMVGMHGTPYANKLIQEADLIVGIGYRFDDRTIGNPKTYGLNAKKQYGIIHIDICEKNIKIVKKIIKPDASLKCDSNKFMKYISEKKFMKKKALTSRWISEKKKEFPLPLNFENKLLMSDIISELGELLKNSDCILTTGVGNHQMVTAQYFKWNYPQKLLTSGSLGTMGTGLPFAIGAQIKYPNRQVICIDGDGSFMMSCQELATISENNLPIKILIFDNEKLQMVHTWQDFFYDKNFISTEIKNPCFQTMAKSFGIKSFFCSKKNKIKETLQKVLFHNGPVLAHFKVESEHCIPFVKPGDSLENVLL